MESTATDDLGEDSDVILEVGFDGKGLDLLELSERSAMGRKAHNQKHKNEFSFSLQRLAEARLSAISAPPLLQSVLFKIYTGP
nr:hypothetical protein CFP56_61207 [Quercus suber]